MIRNFLYVNFSWRCAGTPPFHQKRSIRAPYCRCCEGFICLPGYTAAIDYLPPASKWLQDSTIADHRLIRPYIVLSTKMKLHQTVTVVLVMFSTSVADFYVVSVVLCFSRWNILLYSSGKKVCNLICIPSYFHMTFISSTLCNWANRLHAKGHTECLLLVAASSFIRNVDSVAFISIHSRCNRSLFLFKRATWNSRHTTSTFAPPSTLY